jgi:hypothetical protein
MLPLDDARWKGLTGGYRAAYDASVALRGLERGEDTWDELWNELHHQGDLGEASYAAVPHLVRIAGTSPTRDWRFYGLVSTIEIERHRLGNPHLPDWLADAYRLAWHDLLQLAVGDVTRIEDPLTIRAILGAIALARGDLKLGAVLSQSDASEIDEFLEQRCGWSTYYR